MTARQLLGKGQAAPLSPAMSTQTATPRRMPIAVSLARALRPKQWLKNLLVFAAPLAGGVLFHGPILARSSLAFVSFCLVSSSMYLVNDVVDAPTDRAHPLKSGRPIASGSLSIRVACTAAVGLLLVGVGAGWVLGLRYVIAAVAYAALVTAYSLGLKSIAIIDIAVVAAGFVLRALAGGFATGVPNSRWFLLLTSLGALFVVSGKRYAEVIRNGESPPHRGSPAIYTAPYLRFVWIAASTLTMAAYCLWTFSAHPSAVGTLVDVSAVPFVLAILRYALLIDAGNGGKPEDLFAGDRTLLVLIVLWLLVYGSGVYLAPG